MNDTACIKNEGLLLILDCEIDVIVFSVGESITYVEKQGVRELANVNDTT